MVRALFSLSLLSTATAYQVADMNEHIDYDGMKSSMLGMAKQIKKDGINPGTQGAINGFLKIIKDTLYPALHTDKDNAQASLNAANDAVNKCNGDRTSWTNSDEVSGLVGQNNKVSTEQQDHKSCREQEEVTYANYTSHCSTLENRVCNWGQECALPNFASGDTDAVDVYICCLQDFFALHRPDYYDELENCNKATSLHHAQVGLCDQEQATFQNQFCSRESHIQQKCKWYDDCRCAREKDFEDMKKDVEDLEKIFQTQFVALKHLECYGTQMLQNITDLSGCDAVGDDCEAHYHGDAVTDCPEITYPTPDDFIPCNEPHSNYPCQDAFKTEFYSWVHECTPIDDCDAGFCNDKDITAGTWTGDRKQAYATCD